MRGRLGIAIALVAIGLAAAALASAEVRRSGNIQIKFDGTFTPSSLPREHSVPVTVSVKGSVSTTDGSHPPPLRRIELELNRAGRIATAGLPRCRSALLQSTTDEEALRRCSRSLVGRGRFAAELAEVGDPIPSSGRILIFNAQRDGKPELLLHLHGTTPIQASFVLPLRITHSRGELGTKLVGELPRIAGGVGSVTEIALSIGREYRYRGKRRGYISASCAAPSGFGAVIFTLARGTFHFADGTEIDTALSRVCRVRG